MKFLVYHRVFFVIILKDLFGWFFYILLFNLTLFFSQLLRNNWKFPAKFKNNLNVQQSDLDYRNHSNYNILYNLAFSSFIFKILRMHVILLFCKCPVSYQVTFLYTFIIKLHVLFQNSS